MKLNLEHQLLGLDGAPTTQAIGEGLDSLTGRPTKFIEKPLTVGMVLKAAFNSTAKQGETLKLEDAVKRGKWIISINNKICPDFKVEEQALIKQLCVDSGFAPIVIAQIDELIEGKGK